MLLATSPTLMSHISFEYTNWTKRKADRLFCRCRKGRAFLSRCRDGIFRLIATLFLQRFKGRHACSVAEGLLFVYIKYSPLSINGKLFIHGETPKCSLALSMFSKNPIQIFNLHAFFCNVFHCVLQRVILNINEILHFGFGTEALLRTGRLPVAKQTEIIPKAEDVIKWNHLPRYWPSVRRIHRWLPAQRPVTRSFAVFFVCLNKRLSKQWRGWWIDTPSRPLWRHCNGKQMIVPLRADFTYHSWPKQSKLCQNYT